MVHFYHRRSSGAMPGGAVATRVRLTVDNRRRGIGGW